MDLSCDLRFSFQISSCLIFVTLFYEVVCCFLRNGLVAHWVKASTTEDFESSVAVGKEEHLGSTPDSARLCALHPDLDQIRARHLCHHLSFLKFGLRLTWTYTSKGAVSGDPFKIFENPLAVRSFEFFQLPHRNHFGHARSKNYQSRLSQAQAMPWVQNVQL